MVTEGKGLLFVRVSPNNKNQIRDASYCEKVAFNTPGGDPQEEPAILQYIAAEKGFIWIGYEDRKPKGVIEFLGLDWAIKLPRHYRDDFPSSPLVIIMNNQERVFLAARKFLRCQDSDILYAHGIAVTEQGKGYGSMLQRYALENLPSGKPIVTFIDAAKTDESGDLELIPNEKSIAIAIKSGFVVVAVVGPPVYEEELSYYVLVRPSDPIIRKAISSAAINLAEGDAKEVIAEIRRLTSQGYVGQDYNIKNHYMHFIKPIN